MKIKRLVILAGVLASFGALAQTPAPLPDGADSGAKAAIQAEAGKQLEALLQCKAGTAFTVKAVESLFQALGLVKGVAGFFLPPPKGPQPSLFGDQVLAAMVSVGDGEKKPAVYLKNQTGKQMAKKLRVTKIQTENRKIFGNDEDTVKAYYAGPDKRQWGPKTEQYAKDVMQGIPGKDVKTAANTSPWENPPGPYKAPTDTEAWGGQTDTRPPPLKLDPNLTTDTDAWHGNIKQFSGVPEAEVPFIDDFNRSAPDRMQIIESQQRAIIDAQIIEADIARNQNRRRGQHQ